MCVCMYVCMYVCVCVCDSVLYPSLACLHESACCCVSGHSVETVEYKNISFTVWDVGGQDKVIPSSS